MNQIHIKYAIVACVLSSISVAVVAQDAAVVCGTASIKTGQTFKVNGSDVLLRRSPNDTGEKLVNKKATALLGKTQYIAIDNTTTVKEECTQGVWSRVGVIEPDWLRDTHIGWVKSSELRGERRDVKGITEFTEADFIWDKNTLPHKKIIVAGVNKVHRENDRCKKIDPGTAYVSKDKSTSSNPMFFVTCGEGAGVFNAYFSKSDIEAGKTLAATTHADRSQAIEACAYYAKQQASHPSTVKFSRFMDLAVTEHPNGRTTVISSFSAKNSFNLEIRYKIRCLVEASGVIEGNIAEAR